MKKYLLTCLFSLTDYTEPDDGASFTQRILGDFDSIEECIEKAKEDLFEIAREQMDGCDTPLEPDDDFDEETVNALKDAINEYKENVVVDNDVKIDIGQIATIIENTYDYGDVIDQVRYYVIRIN